VWSDLTGTLTRNRRAQVEELHRLAARQVQLQLQLQAQQRMAAAAANAAAAFPIGYGGYGMMPPPCMPAAPAPADAASPKAGNAAGAACG